MGNHLKPEDLQTTIQYLVSMLSGLSQQDRQIILENVGTSFCLECGAKDPHKPHCWCWEGWK